MYKRYFYVMIQLQIVKMHCYILRYSCTEGKWWKNISLDNQVVVYGMVTEPGETTLIVK